MNRIVVKLSRKGGFVKWVEATLAWEVESVEHLWWRWIMEHTFAWLSTWRRLAKDYEVLPSSVQDPNTTLLVSPRTEG